jgi:signal transduction histidine kinase
VLERFYRVQGTVGEGNGLGLAIADEIARVHTTASWRCRARTVRQPGSAHLRMHLLLSPA